MSLNNSHEYRIQQLEQEKIALEDKNEALETTINNLEANQFIKRSCQGVDANDFRTNGAYAVNGSSDNVNFPTSNGAGTLIAFFGAPWRISTIQTIHKRKS